MLETPSCVTLIQLYKFNPRRNLSFLLYPKYSERHELQYHYHRILYRIYFLKMFQFSHFEDAISKFTIGPDPPVSLGKVKCISILIHSGFCISWFISHVANEITVEHRCLELGCVDIGARPDRRQTKINLLHSVNKRNLCECPDRRQRVFHEAWLISRG